MFTKYFENLKKDESPIIVEGKRDEEALKKWGLKNIMPLNGAPLYEFASCLSEKYDHVTILTDFDKEGSKIAMKLNLFLEKLGVKVNRRIRRKLKKDLTKKGISQIESIK